MRFLRRFIARLSNSVAKRREDERMREEIEEHLALQTAENLRAGLPPAEARRQAVLKFGAVEAIKEDYRAERGMLFIENLLQDSRYALRMLRKSPGFTLIAIVTLALGIGANAVVFSLLNGLVLRPINVPGGKDIYQIEQGKEPSQSYPNYLDIRDRNRAFDGVAAYEIERAGLDTNGTPDPIWIYETSGNYFDMLRVQPFLGRFFHLSDEHGFNSSPYLVLSYGYWQSHFQGDRGVIGRVVRLNRQVYSIAGVAPPDFRGTEIFYSPDVFAPIVDQEQIEGLNSLTDRGNNTTWLVGRLKSGVTVSQAKADLDSIAAVLIKAYPKNDEGLHFALGRPGLVGDTLGGPVRAFVAGLMLLAGLILLATCANLGSLFSARAADRWREVALRLALGSSRGRILRQLLTEAVLVSLGGAALGIAGSIALLRALSAWQPIPDSPINVPVSPDAMTYVFALSLALLSGLLFGLIPVRQVMRANPYQGIKQGSDALAGMRRLSVRDVLLALQIALCAVLVTSSLVAVRGMVRSLHSNFGFDPRNAMQVDTDLSMSGYSGDQLPVVQRRLLEAVSGIPGVTAAGIANRVPLNLGWAGSSVYQDSTTDYRPSNKAADAIQYSVSPGYFEAAKTALLAGRTITWDDSKDATRVGVVNREFARKVFGSEQNAIGRFFKVGGGTRVEVVGIVEDGKYKTLSEDPQPAMFLSLLQSPSKHTCLLVRSNRGPEDLGPALERALNGLKTGLPFTISTWDRELGTALFAARAASLALGVLGGLGAMLAVTGIFGLGAHTVSKRMRELGIRVALGARRKEVLGAALGRVFRLLTFGSAAGLLLGLAATKLLSFIVYQATPYDPLVLAGVVLTMLLLGLLAAWIPAQRALSADPLILLRED